MCVLGVLLCVVLRCFSDTCVGGDCLIVGGFGCWEVFLVDKLVLCLMYALCC